MKPCSSRTQTTDVTVAGALGGRTSDERILRLSVRGVVSYRCSADGKEVVARPNVWVQDLNRLRGGIGIVRAVDVFSNFLDRCAD